MAGPSYVRPRRPEGAQKRTDLSWVVDCQWLIVPTTAPVAPPTTAPTGPPTTAPATAPVAAPPFVLWMHPDTPSSRAVATIIPSIVRMRFSSLVSGESASDARLVPCPSQHAANDVNAGLRSRSP